MDDLTFMASAGLRVLVFAKQKMPSDVDLYIVGAHDAVKETITMTGFHYSCTMLDSYDAPSLRHGASQRDLSDSATSRHR